MGLLNRKRSQDKDCLEAGTIRELRREIKIGAFLVGALVIFAALIFIVGDLSRLFQKKGYPLFVRFDTVAGLEKRTQVRIAGVKVGYVQDIRLKDAQAEVELRIYPEVQIKSGALATQAALGLLGEKYIEIKPGTGAGILEPGGELDGATAIGFDQLGGTLVDVGDQIKDVGDSLKGFLGGEDTQDDFRETLENLSVFTADLKDFLDRNKTDLSRDLRKTSGVIDRIDSRFAEVSQNLDELLTMLKDTVGENRENIQVNLENVKKLIGDLEESLGLLNESLKKVNDGEGTIGKLIHEPELYERAEKAVGTIEGMAQPLTDVRLGFGLRSDYFGDSRLVKNTLSLNVWRNTKQFFIGGITHDPWLERFTYSLQGGLRWGSLAPRAGIMESSFGAGIDYYVLEDRVRLSLEGYDFNRRPRPRFRFWTSLSPTSYLSLLFGVEDFSLAPSRELFFGVRLGL